MSETPKSWLVEARSGSPEGLGRALEACRRYLLEIAQQELDPKLQAKGSASDVVQETFLAAQRDFNQFDGESETELRAWLRQLLLHYIYKFARRYRTTQKRVLSREFPLDGVEQAKELVAATATPSTQAMAQEQAEGVQQALDRLPADYRQVIVWRHQDHCSFEEIARRLGRSVTAVHKLWARAIERLQQEVKRPS
jgi:RNA polymerase sigma-70 factor (ECF subfamily)